MKILIVIPARGGSKGIPRKNIRLMNGKPLISYAIRNALKVHDSTVVVTSDDEEILQISKQFGAYPLHRPNELAADNITLDPVIENAVIQAEDIFHTEYDVVITMQPTSPLLSVNTLNEGIEYFIENGFDTVISGVNQPHLSWRIEGDKCVPNYEERLNRQYMPKNLLETGAFVITKREFVTEKSRFGNKISVFEMPENEAIDIDSARDWWIAETELKKKKICLHVSGYREIGTGHIYRCLQLAASLIEHDILFAVNEESDIAIRMIGESNYPMRIIASDNDMINVVTDEKVDIVVNDVLNTSAEYIKKLKDKDIRVINFEDLGEGAYYADAVINDIYEKKFDNKKFHWDSDFYIIKEEFLMASPKEFADKVNEVLVLFGGTDPNDLTRKVLKNIVPILRKKDIHCTVILGMGYPNAEELQREWSGKNLTILQNVKCISQYMRQADIAVSSRGRTMYELAYMGVPTILLAQNEREMEHIFGGLENGYLNLGLGSQIDENTLKNTIQWLIESPMIRHEMRACLLKKDLGNGLKKVKDIILGDAYENY